MSAAAMSAGGSVTIVSWNVGLRGLARTVNEDYGSLAAMLASLAPCDILCLQETKVRGISSQLLSVYACAGSKSRGRRS